MLRFRKRVACLPVEVVSRNGQQEFAFTVWKLKFKNRTPTTVVGVRQYGVQLSIFIEFDISAFFMSLRIRRYCKVVVDDYAVTNKSFRRFSVSVNADLRFVDDALTIRCVVHLNGDA